MRAITEAELEALPLGAVVLVHDDRSGDRNAWEKFDDVQELQDDNGDLAATAWASAAYKHEQSARDLSTRGRVWLLYPGEE